MEADRDPWREAMRLQIALVGCCAVVRYAARSAVKGSADPVPERGLLFDKDFWIVEAQNRVIVCPITRSPL
ncbi:hypothetical protein HYPGJ_31531 [Hyphomicrobium sp. GJ21]|nr:hypothetical protein HYPGJ_31531 [Hyphomicrobium sp. GJ21]